MADKKNNVIDFDTLLFLIPCMIFCITMKNKITYGKLV